MLMASIKNIIAKLFKFIVFKFIVKIIRVSRIIFKFIYRHLFFSQRYIFIRTFSLTAGKK